MDSQSKIFIFAIIGALASGLLILLFNPAYKTEKIYQTNQRYYPMITEENIKKMESKFAFETSTATITAEGDEESE